MLLLYLLNVPQAPPILSSFIDNVISRPIWWELQTMNFLIMQFSPFSCHFQPLRLNYLPEHPVLANPQSKFSSFSKTTSYVDCHIQSKATFVSLDLPYRCTRNSELKFFGLQMAVCWRIQEPGMSKPWLYGQHPRSCENGLTTWLCQ
jgi:hypothetical protein